MILEARELTFGYGPGAPLLHDWSASFGAGEIVSITGPSGCGKSTLLYLLGLMLRPHSGSVNLGHARASALNDSRRAHARAHHFGFVFQDASLDATRTVLDNIVETAVYRGDPRSAAVGRARELMSQFGVELHAQARPGQISGGQAQRIALCRALLNRPEVLIADEPTGNLDARSADVVTDAFHTHAQSGATVIVATHDPRLVQRCDRTIELA